MRQRQLAIQALRGSIGGGVGIGQLGTAADGTSPAAAAAAAAGLQGLDYHQSPYSSMHIKQEIQIPQVRSPVRGPVSDHGHDNSVDFGARVSDRKFTFNRTFFSLLLLCVPLTIIKMLHKSKHTQSNKPVTFDVLPVLLAAGTNNVTRRVILTSKHKISSHRLCPCSVFLILPRCRCPR